MASNRVIDFSSVLVGLRFLRYTAVCTASPHIVSGSPAANIMALAGPMIVRFALSETPFCSGLYGAVCSLTMPASVNSLLKAALVYSRLRQFEIF